MATNFANGVMSRGIPAEAGGPDLLPGIDGAQVFWLDSAHSRASNNNTGTDAKRPLATLAGANTRATASRGDIVFISPTHAETWESAALSATLSKIGVRYIGLRVGSLAPTITLSHVDATLTISAASTKVKGLVITTDTDNIVSAVTVSAADVDIDIETRDASAAVEMLRSVLTTAGADRFRAKVKHVGFITGAAGVNCVRLIGVDTAWIDVDFYGALTTAVVEFITTLSANVVITGIAHVNGDTTGAKLVVNTGGLAAVWYADIIGAAAGARYTGGSAAALASDDISSITSAIGTPVNAGGTATLGAILGDFVNVTLAARLGLADGATTESIQGKLGTDTELADRSLYDILNGGGAAAFAAAAAPANDVSANAVLRRIYDLLVGTGTVTTFDPRLGKKVTFAAADVLDSVQNALFTITGGRVLLLGLSAEVSVAAVDAGASATNFISNPTVGTDMNLCATLDINADEAGTIYSISGIITDPMTGGSGGGAMGMQRPIILAEGTIDVKAAADVGTGGALLSAECWYIPLDNGAAIA